MSLIRYVTQCMKAGITPEIKTGANRFFEGAVEVLVNKAQSKATSLRLELKRQLGEKRAQVELDKLKNYSIDHWLSKTINPDSLRYNFHALAVEWKNQTTAAQFCRQTLELARSAGPEITDYVREYQATQLMRQGLAGVGNCYDKIKYKKSKQFCNATHQMDMFQRIEIHYDEVMHSMWRMADFSDDFAKGIKADAFVSPSGLKFPFMNLYQYKAEGSLIHVLEHTVDRMRKTTHSVFNEKYGDLYSLVNLLDKSWGRIKNFDVPFLVVHEPKSNSAGYFINVGNEIGTKHQSILFLAIKDGRDVLTAHPITGNEMHEMLMQRSWQGKFIEQVNWPDMNYVVTKK